MATIASGCSRQSLKHTLLTVHFTQVHGFSQSHTQALLQGRRRKGNSLVYIDLRMCVITPTFRGSNIFHAHQYTTTSQQAVGSIYYNTIYTIFTCITSFVSLLLVLKMDRYISYALEKVGCLSVMLTACIKHIHEGKDVLLQLPTSFGKSLCYEALPCVFDQKPGRHDSVVIVVLSSHVPLTQIVLTRTVDIERACAYCCSRDGACAYLWNYYYTSLWAHPHYACINHFSPSVLG